MGQVKAMMTVLAVGDQDRYGTSPHVLHYYNVARILVNPTAACRTVCPTPHIMAWLGYIWKLLVLYTKATDAEERTPSVRGMTFSGGEKTVKIHPQQIGSF